MNGNSGCVLCGGQGNISDPRRGWPTVLLVTEGQELLVEFQGKEGGRIGRFFFSPRGMLAKFKNRPGILCLIVP